MGEELTRTELRRIADEFKSERDAAKRDAMRAFDERNIALNQLASLQAEVDKLKGELADLRRADNAWLPSAVWQRRAEQAERDLAAARQENVRLQGRLDDAVKACQWAMRQFETDGANAVVIDAARGK